MSVERILNQSTSLKDVNIERLKGIFPAAVTEGKINLDKLRSLLGEEVVSEKEVYELTWPGKSEMINHIFDKSTATLRPNRDKSVSFDETNNIYIEGDNYEVLKLLRENYTGKIKCIYIDPPYNTGNDFVYKDDFKDSVENYKSIIENGTDKNVDTSGRFHTDWLNMMYPRVTLARELLKDDGVIFISIDDNEVENLKKICSEIFGEQNFIAQIIWERSYSPVNLKKHFSENHDFILCYSKKINSLICNGLKRSDEANKRYSNPDNDSRGDWKSENFSVGPANEKNIYEIISPSGRVNSPPKGRSWVVSEEKFKELMKDNRIWFGLDGNNSPAQKKFLSEVKNTVTPTTIWKYTEVGHTQDAAKALKLLFNDEHVFDYSKTVELIKRTCELYTSSNDIIMDFFSGSATTAHSVMELNAEDGGNRKFIMVQIPEIIEEKTGARKAGYSNICEIGQERIRRAAKKIKAETNAEIDYGFKVFELDSSNIAPHNESTILREETLLHDRSSGDILYEVIIKHGFPLDVHVEEVKCKHGGYYKIAYGRLFVFLDCINQNLVEEVVKDIHEEQGEDDPNIRFVIKEQLFSGNNRDSDKASCEYLLEQFGYKNIKTI